MFLHDLRPAKGAKKSRKRLGRGTGSGLGSTAGRGNKGQKARTGSKVYSWYEGGQVPLTRRLPKRGFVNARFKNEYKVINLGDIDKVFADGETVCIETLKQKALIKGNISSVKILGNGSLTKKLIFRIDKISKSVHGKIENSGSKLEL